MGIRNCMRSTQEGIREFRLAKTGTRVRLRGRRALPNELARIESPALGHDGRWESTRAEPGPWSETASATIGA